MDSEYSAYELAIASAWASSNFTVWLEKNPASDVEARRRAFLNFFEGGLHLARETAGGNA